MVVNRIDMYSPRVPVAGHYMYLLGVILRRLKVKIYVVKIVKMNALDKLFVCIKLMTLDL